MKLLPLGSVVKLKNGKQKIMISIKAWIHANVKGLILGICARNTIQLQKI